MDLVSLKNHLNEEIEQLRKQNQGIDPTVVLSVDRRVEYGSFLRLFSICQECSPKLRLVYKPSDKENTEYF